MNRYATVYLSGYNLLQHRNSMIPAPNTRKRAFHQFLGITARKIFLLMVIFLPLTMAARAQTDSLHTNTPLPAHPRLLLLAGEEKVIREKISHDKTIEKVQQVLLATCDSLLTVAPVEHIKIGKRLLDKSRECLRRVFYLSYAWRMTHNKNYLQRAEKELLAVAAFSDWNPSHFLDVAEMTMAVAIGYDWLYNDLSETSRKTIREAIVQKGIMPSLDAKYNGWLKITNNWNQVCNAGISFGAIAVYEENPELARSIINRAITSINLPMQEYAPNGAYQEGYGYWGYGTSFNVLFISALEKISKRDFGLSAKPGFLQTARYLQNMTGPTGTAFNYSDGGANWEIHPAMYWFAQKLKDPSLLWVEQNQLQQGTDKRIADERLLPALMIWSAGNTTAATTTPGNNMYVGGGKTPVALMRSSWSDPATIFAGIKGGFPGNSHAHMDIGSFIMESDGVRWAMDFGAQNYESLESKGVDLWNMKQNSQRWQVLRYNNFTHNTLTIDSSLQLVDGFAAITASSNTPLFMNAIVDMTAVYRKALSKASRGIAIVDKTYVVVKDELETMSHETVVRWSMLTAAKVSIINNHTAELTRDGKKLLLQVQEPANISLTTWPTTPVHDYDAPNPGTILVGFEVKLPADTKATLTILLVPAKTGDKTGVKIKSLQEWPPSQNDIK